MELTASYRRLGSQLHGACLAIALATVFCAAGANAQATSGAAKAFAQAQAAELAGKPEEAARFYELAHMLAPTAEALRSAARTRFEAGQRALAASHADALLRQYAVDTKSRAIAQNILDATQGHLVSVRVRCRVPCQIEVDGGATPAPPSEEHVLYMEPGDHRLSASFEGEAGDTQQISGGAGVRLTRNFEPPPRPAQPPPPAHELERATASSAPAVTQEATARGGISRAWFVTSAAVALALAGTAVWSGLDVLSKHDDYKQQPNEAGYEEGLKLERRTNILIGAASAAAATAVVLAFFTKWSRDKEAQARSTAAVFVGLGPVGGSLSITKRF
jgi:hypothetical protein